MSTVNQSMGVTEWILLIILSILWGGSFFFIGVAVTGLPPFTIVAIRVLLAALVVGLLDIVLVYLGVKAFQRETILTKWK